MVVIFQCIGYYFRFNIHQNPLEMKKQQKNNPLPYRGTNKEYLNHVYIVHPVKLFIKTKRIVCHRAVKFLGMGEGVLTLLKYVDAVIVGFICD